MGDDLKKNQKGKHEAKEQRRKRQARQQAGPTERKQEKEPETPKAQVSEKPAYQPPGPEFYKGLKRETDEILKISEEENGKYRSKEIQSNWAKYEMPIETYEEMDEQEQLGADYETLIQAPLSVGTHFQFKHEKSWDVTCGPSPYQKFFDIDMGNLVIALSTIPFYARNNIDKSIFTYSDFLSMDHRANKYKQKYYSDSKYNRTGLESQNQYSESVEDVKNDKPIERCNDITEQLFKFKDIKLESFNISSTLPLVNKCQNPVFENTENRILTITMEEKNINEIKDSDSLAIVKKLEPSTIQCHEAKMNLQNDPIVTNDKNNLDNKLLESPEIKFNDKRDISVPALIPKETVEVTLSQKETSKPIIESPEDLEKWLDDFLDN